MNADQVDPPLEPPVIPPAAPGPHPPGDPPDALGPHGREFILSLYDKLWDNITAKESRIWTFLGIYAGGVGIVLGTGALSSQGFYAIAILLAFTFWAVLIVFDADWWSIRNRMMVSRIERHFPRATPGVVPKIYQDPGFTPNWLHRSSVVIFVAISLVIYSRGLTAYAERGSLSSWVSIVQMLALHLGSMVAMFVCIGRREKQLHEYYAIFRELRAEGKQEVNEADDEKLQKAEAADLRRFIWRWLGIVLFLLATAPVDLIAAIHLGWSHPLWAMAVLLHVVSLVLYVVEASKHYKNGGTHPVFHRDDGGKLKPATLFYPVLLFLAAEVLITIALLGKVQGATSPTDRAAMEQEIEDLHSRVHKVEETMRSEDEQRKRVRGWVDEWLHEKGILPGK